MTDLQRAYDINILAAHRAHDRSDELENQVNDGALKAASLGLRNALAINGGALVALLALIGALVGRDKIDSHHIVTLVSYFTWFLYGIISSVVAMIGVFCAYFLAAFGYNARHKIYEHPYFSHTRKSPFFGRAAETVAVLSIIPGIASIVCFVKGVIAVQTLFTNAFL